jgi:hypothetical protein
MNHQENYFQRWIKRKSHMTAILNIQIDRGGMPRSGIMNKQFDLFIDDQPIAALGWGEIRSFNIPVGKHGLTLKYRKFDICYKLDIQAEEGGRVDIDSFMDTKKGGFTIFNKANGTTSARDEAGSSQTVEKLEKSRRAAREEKVLAVCAIVGLFISMALMLFFWFSISGAIISALIGTLAGGLLGAGINALRRKK